MNYSKIYNNLISTRKNYDRVRGEQYYENHHIIPRCMSGKDDDFNLVLLTPEEHYLAHLLLVKINPKNKQLIYSAKMMTICGDGQKRNNKLYGWIRRKFSENHPCRELDIKIKISKALNVYYSTDEYKTKSLLMKSNYRELRTCLCGCGETFSCYIKEKRQYITAAHSPKNPNKTSNSMATYIDTLSISDKKIRLDNSLRRCDHVQRGLEISKSKIGKKTNQQEIMGTRYSNMSDDEFELFLNTKSIKMRNRFINLRNKYINEK